MVSPGDTFLGDPTGFSGGNHLWIVVAVNKSDMDTSVLAVLVNATTVVPRCDMTCVVNKGDHPFIVHASFIFYQKAAEIPVEDLATLKPQARCSDGLLKRVRQGLHRSPHTKRGLKPKVPQT
ncbi:MAG: hypothetical protein RLZZ450_6974 [Pseudomonadota bacterium]|jgi:hypothetical protein